MRTATTAIMSTWHVSNALQAFVRQCPDNEENSKKENKSATMHETLISTATMASPITWPLRRTKHEGPQKSNAHVQSWTDWTPSGFRNARANP
eukprot:2722272-Lingulodinium_polyedra.AAC.1